MEVINKLLEKSKKTIDLEKEEFSFSTDKDKTTQTLLAISKINIESGELSKNVLEHVKLSSKYRIDNFKDENLEVAISDLIFEILNLSTQLNIDIEKALERKLDLLEKIDRV